MSEELGRSPRATQLRKTRPSLVIVALLAFAALSAAVVVACEETGPSPVGEHFDDAGEDTADAPATKDAAEEGGEGGEAGEDGGGEGGDAGGDAADAADGD